MLVWQNYASSQQEFFKEQLKTISCKVRTKLVFVSVGTGYIQYSRIYVHVI